MTERHSDGVDEVNSDYSINGACQSVSTPDPWPDPVRVDDGVGAFTFVAGIGPALTFVRARS